MKDRVLLDNDIVIKSLCYKIAEEMIAATTVGDSPPEMLSVGKYVALSRTMSLGCVDRQSDADHVFNKVTFVDPSDKEVEIAATLESKAVEQNLELDTGESQLLAILICRSKRYLATGDKRAIIAVSSIDPDSYQNKILCFEQIILGILSKIEFAYIQNNIRNKLGIDKAITICFGKYTPNSEEDVKKALASYIEDLRSKTRDVLIAEPQ
ncbi:hypothetical protein [Roseibium aggregatum]|uniref:Uncharacterized protein n=1 Tax=Roseibium aggregatum TaxID=187304 RepID=A0A939J2U9_9HYPH|nr:hypothetical protein [Roseibium aggregatum]MBN9669480.1 hypothetical protein [Roseibium aggregatum]